MKHFYRAMCLALFCCLSWTVSAETPPLEADFFTTCADRSVSNTTLCKGSNQGTNYGGYIKLDGYDNYYTISNGRLEEFLDGTARLTGTWINRDHSNARFAIDIHFGGRTSAPPSGSPKDHGCLSPNTNGYYYYTHTSGTLTGKRDFAGASLSVSRFGEAFQVGVGANVTHDELTLGASGWFVLSIVNQPSTGVHLNLAPGSSGSNGDININLSGSASACTNSGSISLNCPNDISITAGQGQNSTQVTYSTPNATTTCMVNGGTNCNSVPNSISGFKYLGEFEGSKYYCSNGNNYSWQEAKAISQNSGGHLATICSEAENEFIRSSLLNEDAWIGFTDEQQEGQYIWVTGESCGFTKWRTSSGEPNNGGHEADEHYTRLLRDENGQWTDRDAHYRTEFVMEIPCQSTMVPGDVTVNRTSGLASGSNFPVGMTTITYEAIDECGNTKTCSFKVTVNPPIDPCANNGGDNDGDGVCANDDCNDNDASIGAKKPQGTSCDDGNANTENDVIQADGCSCAGEVIDPCAASGGDNDNDGVCFDDDCNDFNPNVGAKQTPGASCDDGNPNTINDEIQGDGCGCAGLPRGAISVFCPVDITSTVEMGAGGAVVFFGQPNASSSCALGGLNISQTAGPISGSNFPVGMTTVTYTVTDACGNSETCSFKVTVTEMVDPCANNGGDSDGDGVCADDDCDDNNPNVGAKVAEGTACNDGNSNTMNDVIQADGCTCEGEEVSSNLAKVGDFVFRDNNGNGIQDSGEPGIENVFILLTNVTTGAVKFMTSGVDGMYMFGDLEPGDYTLKFVGAPNDLIGTNPNQGGDDSKDSDADPMTGITPVFTLAAGDINNDIDAGFRPKDIITDPCDGQGGDSDGDGICDNQDNCDFTANPDQADNDGDGIGNVCDDTPNGNGGDLDCNDAVVVGESGKVTISNIAAGAKVEISGPSTGWGQDLVCEGDCNAMEMISGLSAGDYSITIQTFNPYCYNRVTVTVTDGGGNPCDGQGGDSDGDGICDNQDNCDFTANPDQADNDGDGIGNVCDDTPNGNGNPCDGQGGDSDGDGICDNQDNCDFTANPDQADNDGDGIGNVCDDTPNGNGGDVDCNDAIVVGESGKVTISNLTAGAKVEISGPSTGWGQVLVCEGDCNAMEMVADLSAGDYSVTIQTFNPYCYNRVTVTVTGGGGNPCDDKGGDSDGDGICDADDNCDFTANPDQADNDGDGIGNVCDDTPNGNGNPCDGQGGDSDGDGVCDNQDNCDFTSNPDQADNDGDGIGNVCDDTPNGNGGDLDCNDAVVVGESGKVTISNIAAGAKVEISGPSTGWGQDLVCEGDCNAMEMVSGLSAGDYSITIQTFNPYCYNRVTVTVTDGGGNPCDGQGGDSDGDGICDNQDNCDFTANPDQADNDGDGIGNVCDDTPNGNGNPCDGQGGDSDGDGVCDNQDNCDLTANPDQADNDGDGIGNVCDDTPNGEGGPDCNAVVVSGEPGKLIISNLTAPIVAINILDKNAGYGSIYECFNNCDVPMTMLVLPASDYLVKVQFYNSSWGFVCEQAFDATVPQIVNPCAANGGDADGDGVCADDDCDDNNPNVGGQQAPGTGCNDGNPDTENDVIQGDGCSCAGTPVGPSKCANRTVINTQRCGDEDIVYGFYIVTNGIDKRYTWDDGVFMEFDDGTAMLSGHIVNNGDSQIGFDVNINLTGRTTNSPTGAAKEHACLHPDESSYYYYADFTGTLMGTGSAAGAVLTLRDHGQAFQVGVGANVTNEVLSFGASGWLKIDVQSQPSGDLHLDIYDGATNGQNGDININLTGNGTECPNGASSRTTPGSLNISATDISVYPNPAQEELNINLSKYNGKSGNIKVLNLYGQLVQELEMDEITTDILRLDLSNFQNGLYHLNIKVENAQPITKKILVSRLY